MAHVLYLALTLSAAVLPGVAANATVTNVCACDNTRVETVKTDYKKTNRPAPDARLFKSKEVDFEGTGTEVGNWPGCLKTAFPTRLTPQCITG